MLLYEIDKKELRIYKGDVKKAIRSGMYIERDESFVKQAFNFGNGTKKHMNKYMKNNACFCKWYNAKTLEEVKRI